MIEGFQAMVNILFFGICVFIVYMAWFEDIVPAFKAGRLKEVYKSEIALLIIGLVFGILSLILIIHSLIN